MESVGFWQQKGQQFARDGKTFEAMDYYRQGLRKHPTEHVLIYCVAACYA